MEIVVTDYYIMRYKLTSIVQAIICYKLLSFNFFCHLDYTRRRFDSLALVYYCI